MNASAPDGPRLPPAVRISDVAALAGVAPGTASKALNGTGSLRNATRDRVRQAAAQLGFTPDSRARALKSGRSYTVGLLTTDSIGRFSIPVLLGAEDALSAGEMAVLLCDTRDDPLREQHYLRTLRARHVDGIIVTGRRTDPRPPVRVDVPVVYAFTPCTDPDTTSVLVAEGAGAAEVVRHLLQLGRRRIAHVTGPRTHSSARVRAEQATASAGEASAGPALFGEWSERWGRQATDLVLAGVPDLDAISCGSDQIARGVCDRLRERGLSVPSEVAVTGFDNWDVMAQASRPPLTTVDLQLEEVGREAARLLLEAVSGAARSGTTVIDTRLVVRESTLDG